MFQQEDLITAYNISITLKLTCIHFCFIDSLTVEAAEGNIYSAQALMTAVVASCLVTLMVGFVIGYLFSRRFRHPFLQDTSPFNEQHNQLNRYGMLFFQQ